MILSVWWTRRARRRPVFGRATAWPTRRPTGACAKYVCLPEDRLTPVPDGVSEVDALGDDSLSRSLHALKPWRDAGRLRLSERGAGTR
ncbi:MAG: hypothetical protein R6V26_09985, partial [Roseovarius sp.]